MRRVDMTLRAMVFLLGFAVSAPAMAHGVWVAERAGELALIYGHGASDEAYDPAKLESVLARNAGGKELEVDVADRDTHVTFAVPDDAVQLAYTFDNGFWTQAADGNWINEPKSAVADAQRSGHYLKYGTAVVGSPSEVGEPLGLAFEIVPLSDPMRLEMGDTLPVLVLLDGEPIEGVAVTAEYTTDSEAEPILSDADGKAEIVIRNQGLNVIAASHSIPTPDSPDADQRGLHSTLSFTLGYHGS